jgi:hypothetical protein
MTSDDKLTALRAMSGETDEGILSTYLRLAAEIVLNKAYPYNPEVTEVPARYDFVQIEVAVYMLSKRDGEYQTSSSENGISRSWESGGVPPSLLSRITPFCGVIK